MSRRTIRHATIGCATTYVVLWVLTAGVGAPDLQARTARRLRDELLELRPNAEIHVVEVDRYLDFPPHPYYGVATKVPAPLLIHVKYVFAVAPLSEYGRSDWYVWLFGFRVHLASTQDWIS